MLHFEPNNLTYKLVDLLSITDEFPASSLYLVGKERVVKALVKNSLGPMKSAAPLPNYPVFYSSKVLKQVDENGIKRVMFTRVVGLLVADGVGYAVYNMRNALMKWNGNGEAKAKWYLTDIVRANVGLSEVDSAILFGKTNEVALKTLEESERNRRLDLRFDGIYPYIYFIPLNEFGVRQLKVFGVPNWKEKRLGSLFDPRIRSYNKGAFEYDAFLNGTYVYSFLDGDIARLVRLKMAVKDGDEKIEVICFPHQLNLLKSYIDLAVTYQTLKLSAVEEALEIT